MEVIETIDALERLEGVLGCVLATSLDSELARSAADRLGLDLHPGRPAPRRPHALVDGAQADLVLASLTEDRTPYLVQVLSTGEGLLIVAPEEGLELVRTALARAAAVGWPEGTWDTAVVVILAVARHCDDVLEEIGDECQELGERSSRFSSAPKRRTITQLRTLLFRLQETHAAQNAMLSDEEEFAQLLGPSQQTMLGRAAIVFDANRSTAARLYAMLGDLLGEQDTQVSERLTLVATIFLPLTLSTGFFGMNFDWLDGHLRTLPAFLLGGLLIPALFTLITYVCIHRFTRSS